MVEYDVENGVARLTINQPERRNPMSTDTMAALAHHMQAAVVDPEVRVVVFTGAGDKAFSAGGDLSGGFVDDPVGLHRQRGLLADLFRTMWRGGKPTIARVNGHALAGLEAGALPLPEPAAAEPDRRRAVKMDISFLNAEQKRLLIVDDELSVREVLADDIHEGFLQTETSDVSWDGVTLALGYTF